MTYYVEKQLAFGPIRFGVSTRQALDAIDDDLTLSTGANGEFIRRRKDGFFFGDTERVVGPSIPVKPTINQTPFWSSLKPAASGSYLWIALMGFGALIMLLGIAVLLRKGPQGWFEIIFGAICIPFRSSRRRSSGGRSANARSASGPRDRKSVV